MNNSLSLCLVLAAGLLSAAAAPAADTNAPAAQVTAPAIVPGKLTAFMEQWKTYRSFQVPMDESDRPLLLAALAKDPTGPWATYLDAQAAETRYEMRHAAPPQRKALAAAILPTL